MPITTTLVDHPVVADALTRIRDRDTPNALFRQNLERIGMLLLAEATRTLPTVDGTVETPLTTAPARRIASQPVVVPILRAGLGFVGAAQELLPNADLGFIGMAFSGPTLGLLLAFAFAAVGFIVPGFVVSRRARAASNTFLRSATPEKIAEICSKCRSVACARSRATVVLPVPGGPQKMSEPNVRVSSKRASAPSDRGP